MSRGPVLQKLHSSSSAHNRTSVRDRTRFGRARRSALDSKASATILSAALPPRLRAASGSVAIRALAGRPIRAAQRRAGAATTTHTAVQNSSDLRLERKSPPVSHFRGQTLLERVACSARKRRARKCADQSDQQPMSVHRRVPVVTAAKCRRQFSRRRHVCVAVEHVTDLVWIFFVHAPEREFGEALRRFCVESASGRIRRGGVRRFGCESHRRNEQEHKQKIFHFQRHFAGGTRLCRAGQCQSELRVECWALSVGRFLINHTVLCDSLTSLPLAHCSTLRKSPPCPPPIPIIRC